LCIALLVLSLYPIQPVALGVPFFDKWTHFIAFFTLYSIAFTEHIRVRSSIEQGRWLIKVAVPCVLFGILIELLQWLIPTGRHAELLDILADGVGVALGMILCNWVKIEQLYPRWLR